jgi:hypothetical protein
MPPPVEVLYVVNPFYQNFNDYMKSEVSKELTGQEVPDGLREAVCHPESLRVDGAGQNIVPCGMKALSTFNDTYSISLVDGGAPLTIDQSNIAWASDVERYNNPADYNSRPNTAWLWQRLPPDVVSKEQGVKSQPFAAWMRPAALPYVQNRYGTINQLIEKGQKLRFTIRSNYPTESMEVSKQVVLTTRGPLGGRSHGMGYFLLCSGAILVVLACLVKPLEMLMHNADGDDDTDDESRDPSREEA